MGRYLVFNIGCIECGVSSDVVGIYETREQADRVAALLQEKLSWRQGGQNAFEVFDLEQTQAREYHKALSGAQKTA